MRYRTLREFSRKQLFIVPAQTQQTRVQRLSPKNKGVSPFIPLQASYRSKKARSNPYMVIYNSLGYFTPVLCVFPPPQCYVTLSMSDSSGFMSLLCHPYLPATLSELRPSLFFLSPLPTTQEVSIWKMLEENGIAS
jgi:hypothetical protein